MMTDKDINSISVLIFLKDTYTELLLMRTFTSYLCFLLLLFIFFVSVQSAQSIHQVIQGYSLYDVHSWPNSRCDICHMSSSPRSESAELVNDDLSRLCESCHKGTVTVLSSSMLKSTHEKMNNHPIKFSPLVFDAQKINHNIIKEGKYFYVAGKTEKVPLFGETKYTAVAECATCHESHGKSGLPKLKRIDDAKGELCLVCHISIKP